MLLQRQTTILITLIALMIIGCVPRTAGNSPAPTDTSMLDPTKSPAIFSPSPALTSTSMPTPPTAVTASVSSTPSVPSATATSTVAPSATAIPSTPTPTSYSSPDCKMLPEGVFLTIWERTASFQAVLGCPTSTHPRIEPAAWEVETSYQLFEHGAMIWSNQIGWYQHPVIYVLYDDGTFQRFEDTYDSVTDSVAGEMTPPAGLYEPILGFGKIWREQPGVREALGWATVKEIHAGGRFQTFAGGAMIWLSQRGETYVLFDDRYVIVDSPTFDSISERLLFNLFTGYLPDTLRFSKDLVDRTLLDKDLSALDAVQG